MANDTTNWTELREFAAVDLTQSFVLGWETEANALIIELDLSLLPTHSFYEEPRPAEGGCFRPAVIEFPDCTAVAEPGEKNAGDIEDVLASLGAGRIDSLKCTADGRYEISGQFGTVEIEAERPLLRLKGFLS